MRDNCSRSPAETTAQTKPGRLYGRIQPHQQPAGFKTTEEIWDRSGLRYAIELSAGRADRAIKEIRSRLIIRAVEPPGVLRHDPADALRGDALGEQPQAGVDSRLAGADDGEIGRRALQLGKAVDGNEVDVARDLVFGRMRRRDLGPGMGRVDDPARPDGAPLSAHQRNHLRGVAVPPDEIVQRQKPDAAGGKKTPSHHRVEIGEDFGAGRETVIAGVRPGLVLDAIAEFARRDAVIGRRLMQADEGIGVVPVTARRRSAIHHRHVRLGFAEQRVDESHRRRARAYNEIIALEIRQHWLFPESETAAPIASMSREIGRSPVFPQYDLPIHRVKTPSASRGANRTPLTLGRRL